MLCFSNFIFSFLELFQEKEDNEGVEEGVDWHIVLQVLYQVLQVLYREYQQVKENTAGVTAIDFMCYPHSSKHTEQLPIRTSVRDYKTLGSRMRRRLRQTKGR